MKGKRGGMTIVSCDFAFDVRNDRDDQRACPIEFRSASFAEVIAVQMLKAGWKSRTTKHGTQWLCPHHGKRMGKLVATRDLTPPESAL